jgi:hypothetical protein
MVVFPVKVGKLRNGTVLARVSIANCKSECDE